MGQQAYESLSGFQEESCLRSWLFVSQIWFLFYFQIRKKNQNDKYNDLLSMLDKYMETGCSQTARDLVDQGINIPFKRGWEKPLSLIF